MYQNCIAYRMCICFVSVAGLPIGGFALAKLFLQLVVGHFKITWFLYTFINTIFYIYTVCIVSIARSSMTPRSTLLKNQLNSKHILKNPTEALEIGPTPWALWGDCGPGVILRVGRAVICGSRWAVLSSGGTVGRAVICGSRCVRAIYLVCNKNTFLTRN